MHIYNAAAISGLLFAEPVLALLIVACRLTADLISIPCICSQVHHDTWKDKYSHPDPEIP